MDLRILMETKPEDLAKLQFRELKSYAVNIIQETLELLMDNNFEAVKKKMCYSPSGDGYGMDNYFINFNYDNLNHDLFEIIDLLERLNKVTNKN